MKYIGVDLGWSSGASGLALLELRSGKAPHFVECARILHLDEILLWISARQPDVVAVDAPLRLGNASGMRLAEKEAHRLYGRFDAGCYPSSQSSSFAARTTGFSAALAALGFPLVYPHQKCQFECFPHILAVEMFELEKIFKYKKGSRAARAAELTRLREMMLAKLPVKGLDRLPDIPAKGDLKPVEDRLDAVLCAYAAFYWGRWGLARNRILGDLEEGCIVVPMKC
jgi:predicted RNase H-like nuclease